MPVRTVSDDQLHARLLELFRSSGFDGASLSDLQDVTGLKRSSLYHRFPGGKLEMATAVLDAVADHFEHVVLAAGHDLPLDQRIKEIGARIAEFFGQGHLSCLVATMSIGPATEELAARTNATMTAWIRGFASLSRQAGLPVREATNRATDAIAAIEGALIVARTSGDTGAFDRAIASLPDRLTT